MGAAAAVDATDCQDDVCDDLENRRREFLAALQDDTAPVQPPLTDGNGMLLDEPSEARGNERPAAALLVREPVECGRVVLAAAKPQGAAGSAAAAGAEAAEGEVANAPRRDKQADSDRSPLSSEREKERRAQLERRPAAYNFGGTEFSTAAARLPLLCRLRKESYMPAKPLTDGFVERVELSGHIIDSLLLPKVLDDITAAGGRFQIKEITVGQAQRDPSYALIEVHAPSAERLQQILADIADHGAVAVDSQDARLVAADIAGAFPEGFYSTTNQRTEVRLGGEWIEVEDQEMDCGIARRCGGRAPPAACR